MKRLANFTNGKRGPDKKKRKSRLLNLAGNGLMGAGILYGGYLLANRSRRNKILDKIQIAKQTSKQALKNRLTVADQALKNRLTVTDQALKDRLAVADQALKNRLTVTDQALKDRLAVVKARLKGTRKSAEVSRDARIQEKVDTTKKVAKARLKVVQKNQEKTRKKEGKK